ncbi:hypothetical protein [Undibacterium sp.]|uniref:hypothetical protein n=1 Tax=Undibacterium sp. TaxID=1914977 RepID=UPI0025DE7147|nr:hypothetical protein [Undibacterium sp.]
MDIAALNAVSTLAVAPVYVAATKATTAIDGSLTSVTPLKATEVNVVDNRDTVVQFSSLAQLLEATLAFDQTQSVATQSVNVLNAQTSAAVSSDFSKLFGTAQAFVDAFNNFQNSSSNSLDTPFGSAFDNALLLAIHAQSGTGNGISLIDNLATIGINFQEPSASTDTGTFSIDLNSLQAAFNLDPVKTSEVLTKSLQTLAGIEAKLISLPSLQSSSLLTSDQGNTFSTSLPGSPFDTSTVTGRLDKLSSTDALKVNIALKRLMQDEALVTALGVNTNAAATTAGAALNVGNSATNVVSVSDGAALPIVQSDTSQSPASAILSEMAGAPAMVSAPLTTSTANASVSPTALVATPLTNAAPQLQNIAQTQAGTDLNILNAANSARLQQNALANTNSFSGARAQTDSISSTRASYLPIETGAPPSTNLATSTAARVLAARINVSPASVAVRNVAPGVAMNTAVSVAPTQNASVGMNAGSSNAAETGVSVSAANNNAQVPAPFAALNPYLAAAVATYRVNEAMGRVPSYELVPRVAEMIPGVAAVSRVRPVSLDLHENANDSRSNQTRRSAVGAPVSPETKSIGEALPTAPTAVDVTV